MYHAIIKKEPEYPATFPPLAKDLCNKLLWFASLYYSRTSQCSHTSLSKTYQSRLGSGSGGGRDIQAHPYFRGLDWEALLQRDVAMDKDWIPLIDERDGVQVSQHVADVACHMSRDVTLCRTSTRSGLLKILKWKLLARATSDRAKTSSRDSRSRTLAQR